MVQRRLEITAHCDLRCSLFVDNVIRSTVQVTADSHSAGLISTICNQFKYSVLFYHFSHSYAILMFEANVLIFRTHNLEHFNVNHEMFHDIFNSHVINSQKAQNHSEVGSE